MLVRGLTSGGSGDISVSKQVKTSFTPINGTKQVTISELSDIKVVYWFTGNANHYGIGVKHADGTVTNMPDASNTGITAINGNVVDFLYDTSSGTINLIGVE